MSVSIPVVLGTGRIERQSGKVARFVHSKLADFEGISTDLVDVRDYLDTPFTVPAWVEDTNASRWREIAHEASGFVFVVPEYNRSFPGEFKLLFDSAFKEYKNKPVILVGVSSGQYGGVRVIQGTLAVLHAASMNVLGAVVATANVKEAFEDQNTKPDEKYEKFVEDALNTLVSNIIKIK